MTKLSHSVCTWHVPSVLCLVVSWTFVVAAQAQPRVTLTPPNLARFVVGQRFDIRVEGQGKGPFSASLAIDGVPQHFSSGEQASDTTDGITTPGFGGFNLRGYSHQKPGAHRITATFTDATGTVQLESRFEIVELRGPRKPARNVIILLGDGMGAAQRTAARIVRFGGTRGDPDGYLAMDSFPVTGMVTTHSLDSLVTDSAPGMAAYSSGAHAANTQEGVYPAHMLSPFFYPRVEYMGEYLHRTRGTSLGLVTTADITDATPAANAVHTGDRTLGTGIADQYLEAADVNESRSYGSGLRVLMGGGRSFFLPAGSSASSRAAANDQPVLPQDLAAAWHLPQASVGALDPGRNLLGDFQAAGFAYVADAHGLSALAAAAPPDKLLGLFGFGNMNSALDKVAKRRNALLPGATGFVVDDNHAPDQPMLDEMAQAALRVLHARKQGFVLLIEGALIDKNSHAMDAERAIADTLEFDRAVAVARGFAEHVDRQTVVIVTADHECSGFSLIGTLPAGAASAQKVTAAVSSKTATAHQGTTSADQASGFPRYTILLDGYPESFDVDGKLLVAFGAAQARGATHAGHTAVDVPISAYAAEPAMVAVLAGVQRNTDVFFKLMRAMFGGY